MVDMYESLMPFEKTGLLFRNFLLMARVTILNRIGLNSLFRQRS
jgi:hypothetical protein